MDAPRRHGVSERSQTQKATGRTIPFMRNVQKRKIYRDVNSTCFVLIFFQELRGWGYWRVIADKLGFGDDEIFLKLIEVMAA